MDCSTYGGGDCGPSVTTTPQTTTTVGVRDQGNLPVTGGDFVGISAIGVALILGGAWLARRRAARSF